MAVTPAPQIEIVGRRELCLGDRIQLSGYYGQDYIYQWRQTAPAPAQVIGTDPHIDEPADHVGTSSFQLVVAPPQNSACSSTDSVDVTVRPLPSAPYIQINPVSCVPYSFKLVASPYDPYGTYRWSDRQSGESISVNRGGAYCVYYTDTNGCSVQSPSISIPHAPDYYFWTFPKGCYTFCWENLPRFIHGPVGFPNGEYWHWEWWKEMQVFDFGDSPSYSNLGLNPPLKIDDAGTFQMYLENYYCNDVTEEMTVEIAECKECDFKIIIDSVCYNKSEGTATAYVSIYNPYGANFNYSVQSLSGLPVQPSSGTLVPGSNIFFLTLTIDNFSPIPYPETLSFTIWNPAEEWFYCIDNVVTFDIYECDKNTDGKALLSLNDGAEAGKNLFFLYPNPTAGSCTVQYAFEQEAERTVTVRDNRGRELARHNLPYKEGSLSLDLSAYGSGVYFVECRRNGKLTHVLKAIKKQ